MKIRARRGVCIGVDKHLKAGEEADLERAMVTYLVGIGAVEVVKDLPEPVPAAGKASADGEGAQSTLPESSDAKASAGKGGKKG